MPVSSTRSTAATALFTLPSSDAPRARVNSFDGAPDLACAAVDRPRRAADADRLDAVSRRIDPGDRAVVARGPRGARPDRDPGRLAAEGVRPLDRLLPRVDPHDRAA